MLNCCQRTLLVLIGYFIFFQINFHRITSMWNEDICTWLDFQTLDVDVHENGILHAKNLINQMKSADSITSGLCSVTLATCPSCHLILTITDVNLISCSNDGKCKCDYLNVAEVGHRESGRNVCGLFANDSFIQFESVTSKVIISYFYTNLQDDPFYISFQSLRNTYTISGSANLSGIIQSPFFSTSYPKDYSAFYSISSPDPWIRIRLIFLDFFLSKTSYIEVFDISKAQRLGVFFGETFRPSVITVPNTGVELNFFANGKSSIGFLLKYSFFNANDSLANTFVNTSCSRQLQPYGGTIELVNITTTDNEVFDCVWLVEPLNDSRMRMMAVTIGDFVDMSEESTLEIHKGQISTSPLLFWASGDDYEDHTEKKIVVRSTTGLYIRFKGRLSPESKVTVIYAAFGFFNCYSPNYFQCRNKRCIMRSLVCDGFDHCSDGSDEAESCFDSNPMGNKISTLFGTSWWDKYPNYNLRPVITATPTSPDIPLLACSLALIIIVLTMILVMCWLCLKGKNAASPIHNGIASSRGTLGFFISTPPDEAYLDSPPDSPPLYEAPPSYEEVMKVMKALASDTNCTESSASNDEGDRHKNESPSTSQSRLRRLFLTPFTTELWQLAASGIDSLPRAVSSKFSPRKLSDPFPGVFNFDRSRNNENKLDHITSENNDNVANETSSQNEYCYGATARVETTILNPKHLSDQEISSENASHSYQTWPLSLGGRKKNRQKTSFRNKNDMSTESAQSSETVISDVSPTRSVVMDREFILASLEKLPDIMSNEILKDFDTNANGSELQTFHNAEDINAGEGKSSTFVEENLMPFDKPETASLTKEPIYNIDTEIKREEVYNPQENSNSQEKTNECTCQRMEPSISSSVCSCHSFLQPVEQDDNSENKDVTEKFIAIVEKKRN